MNHRLLLTAVAVAALLLSGNRAFAEGWGLSSWNPFGKREVAETDGADSPRLLEKLPLPAWQRGQDQPTPLDRINQGARNVWTKTKNILSPWDESPSSAKASDARGWGILPWNQEPPPPQTLPEFLKQPMPR